MQLCTLLLLPVLVMAHLPPCTQRNRDEVLSAVSQTALSTSCATDAGVSMADLLAFGAYTPAQVTAVTTSPRCKELFAYAQAVASQQACAEAASIKEVSWSMVTEVARVATYPRVATQCPPLVLRDALQSLVASAYLAPCLEAADVSVLTTTLPTQAQWDRLRATTACRDWFLEADAALYRLPHCAIDASGVDIHALRQLSFDTYVDVLQFVSNVFRKTATTQLLQLAARLAAPSTVRRPVLIGVALTGAFLVALVALIVYRKVTAPRHGYEHVDMIVDP
ncbi:hypothetical protein SDRG_07705 [Saprolegnia diclina VS20]|uniref:Uncharacterized protein n=1 Tax=Saprolegnia diclina (strain VS20) TaxID=1156394 RepID=T0QJL3_SAPDV|nr:hypothetical protein SDRG_07705 [Saprolegnia diclina VS20]EQC34906.1 hypothetical protein SDRG_07705 [Saprolegnia diclina VS20]|eukprot:XP_008611778.1 hypothetical protein SDRG_07705 [Saprolegnia diclina VS20]